MSLSFPSSPEDFAKPGRPACGRPDFFGRMFGAAGGENVPFLRSSRIKRYNSGVRIRALITSLTLLATISLAQDTPDKTASDKTNTDKKTASDDAGSPAAREHEAGESSSRDTRIDTSAPSDDAKNHPGSKEAVADLDGSDNPDTSGVQEFHPWNPLKARKDVEVGDYYFKQKNYKGALERYKDALYNKQGDAVAISRMAVCESKLGNKDEAKKYYEQYLKILPDGPFAKEARASLDKMAKAQ
jgi:tetratricopeptide (TPR) repeat protein